MGLWQYLYSGAGELIAKLHSSMMAPQIIRDRSTLFRLEVAKEHRRKWGDSWYRAGVIVVNDNGEFLLVEETRRRVNGVWCDVRDTWNLPAGSCEEDERFIDAAVREAHEELGRGVKLKGICALKHGQHNDDPCLLIVFLAELTNEIYAFDHQEIRSQRWFSRAAIYELARQDKLRSADLVLQSIGNCQKGLIMPLEILNEYQPL